MRKLLIIPGLMILLATSVNAGNLVNVDKQGLALQGYDPVAFFTEGKPVRGDQAISTSYQGAAYRFASEEHRTAFQKEPGRYTPAFGGFCAYAVSRGYTASVEIETWQLIDGRLVLNYDQKIKGLFDADREGNMKKADSNWPGLLEKKGR